MHSIIKKVFLCISVISVLILDSVYARYMVQ